MKSLKYSLIGLVVLMMISCAALSEWYTKTDYKTFELTISGEKVAVNLPDKLPSMTNAIFASEGCFSINMKVCMQRFCLNKEAIHDHIDFIYSGIEVIALVWTRPNAANKAWVYLGKKPILAPIKGIKELIKKYGLE